MMTMNKVWNRKNTPLLLGMVAAFSLCLAVAQVACTTTSPGGTQPSGNGNGNDNSGSPIGGAVLNIQTDVTLSGGQSITILYTTPTSATNVRAFYVPVEGSGTTATETGDEVELLTGLSAGSNQSFNFNTSQLDPGTYKVGIRYNDTDRLLSNGVITITGLPAPDFLSPDQSQQVVRGDQIDVRVDLGSAENSVNWRLFFIPFGSETVGVDSDQLGSELRTGTQNVVIYYWNTAGVEPGQYTLGISSTDSGKSISQTVAAGEEDLIVTALNDYVITVLEDEPDSTKPSITFTQPSGTTSVFGDQDVPLEFTATAFDGDPDNWKVDIYYDTNAVYSGTDGTETMISTDLPINTTNASFDTNEVEEGTYYIGGIARDGVNTPGIGYAKGKVVVSRTPSLTVIEPQNNYNADIGEAIEITWTSNIPTDDGTVSVNIYRVDADGAQFGSPEKILSNEPLSTTKTEYTTEAPGRYQVEVTITFTDGEMDPISAYAPAFIRVTTLPTIWWVGSLFEELDEGEERPFAGAGFEGHQYEDNFGNTFIGGEDFDNDGNDDFVIASLYGKPEFINPDGIGEGEIYLVRGGSVDAYPRGTNINKLGTELLPGIIITPPTPLTPAADEIMQTYGVRSLELYPDADGDGTSELVIGLPRIDSLDPRSSMGRVGMFQGGGVVIVSSMNSQIRGLSETDIDGERLRLDSVGQNFVSDVMEPESGQDQYWVADRFEAITDGECPELDSEDCVGSPSNDFYGCRYNPGQDGVTDTFVGPGGGFLPFMAYPWTATLGFVWNDYSWSSFSDWRDKRAKTDAGELACPTYNSAYIDVCGNASTNGLAENTCEPTDRDVIFPEPIGPGDFDYYNFECAMVPLELAEYECEIEIPAPTAEDPDATTNGIVFADAVACLNLKGMECDDQKVFIQSQIETSWPAIEAGIYETGFIKTKHLGTDTNVSGCWSPTPPSWNFPQEPFGARIIGRPSDTVLSEYYPDYDTHHPNEGNFGWDMAVSGKEIIVMAPSRTASADPANFDSVIAHVQSGLMVGDFWTGLYQDAEGIPDKSSEGHPPYTNPNSGIAYMFTAIDLWQTGLTQSQYALQAGGCGAIPNDRYEIDKSLPPKPHMYMAGGYGHTASPDTPYSGFARSDLILDRQYWEGSDHIIKRGGIAIVGGVDENIRQIISLNDFNRDTRSDLAIGSPKRNSDDGAVYVIFRRAPSVEGDYILEKLAYASNNANRLAGVLLNGPSSAGEGFGKSLATNVDFNGDDEVDLVIGNENGNGGTGEVYIVFASDTLITPQGGIDIETVHSRKQCCRILGNAEGDLFGFNVSDIGDINGDGHNDLAISAPWATPHYDSDPFDATDTLNTPGLDMNLDGQKDDVTGPKGYPDGVVDSWDSLEHAGLTYVIFGGFDVTETNEETGTNPWKTNNDTYEISIGKLGTKSLPGFILVGHSPFDQMGGGYAGDPNPDDDNDGYVGGSIVKSSDSTYLGDETNGRSFGLAPVGDVNGDGYDDFMIGSILADPRKDPNTGAGVTNAGEAYLIYGFRK